MAYPPITITTKILNLTADIQVLLGHISGVSSHPVPTPNLRRENRIRTIKASLAIEGNSLTEDQITAILEKKRVIGPRNQILEVENALKAYDLFSMLNPVRESDLLRAHKVMMSGLINQPGRYRSTSVGIMKGSRVEKMAPSAKLVPTLMGNLFDFLAKNREFNFLLKACIFHYELEFIHPFSDGNGRMGRLWQHLLLTKHAPAFQFVSVESLIKKNQSAYYRALESSDVSGECTVFVEYCLEMILIALRDFECVFKPEPETPLKRLEKAHQHFNFQSFSRKQYMSFTRSKSTATASRDLALGVENNILIRTGNKALARYRFRKL